MSNKQQQKEKRKAKQRSMAGIEREDLILEEPGETEGIDEVLRIKGSTYGDSDPKNASKAVNAALADAKAGAPLDPRLEQLFKDFKLYRILVIAFVVVGFTMVLAAMGLYNNGTIDGETQGNVILFANLVVLVGLVIAFGRARPIREDITAWNKVNALAWRESKGAHGATEADIDKIFLTRARNKRVPPDPEFKSYRRLWFACIIGASALLVVAAMRAQQAPDSYMFSVVLVVVATIMLGISVYLDRRKMKPMRERWIQQLDAKVKAASRSKKK